jgi:hypothetical protein
MPTPIRVVVGSVTLDAELSDTPCARAVAEALPIEASISTWGDEFYFSVPVRQSADDTATLEVKVGDIGYWPPGEALAIFFGPTPASTGDDPVPASDVNVVGRILGDARSLKNVARERSIRIERP